VPSPAVVPTAEAQRRLQQARDAFRRAMAEARAAEVWAAFKGRVGLVLSGGGARGAYEAGALLAFQDAGLPTPLIAATSIGSINVASYAAHAESAVGNAEPLVASWFELTPGALGIEWTRYAWMLGGLIALSAGIGNLAYYLATLAGFHLHLIHPASAWLTLALGGASILLFYPQLPYVHFAIARWLRRRPGAPDHRRLRISALANLLVLSFLVAAVESLRLLPTFRDLLRRHPLLVAAGLVALLALRALQRRHRGLIGRTWGRLLMLPLNAGLFKNFERTRYLRARIPADRLRLSPIRLVITATDLDRGAPRYYTNTPLDTLATDPAVDGEFVTRELVHAGDLMPAIIGSSALPIAFEPHDLGGHVLADGAIVGSQPIRPAIRLGADVLFIVLLSPPRVTIGPGRTFVDIGMRALDILMSQNLRTDLQTLSEVNALCERAAADLGIAPELITLDLGHRRFRYVRPFTIRPAAPLGAGMLDFGGPATGDAMLQGYRDAVEQIRAFLAYAPHAPFGQPRRALRLTPEEHGAAPAT